MRMISHIHCKYSLNNYHLLLMMLIEVLLMMLIEVRVIYSLYCCNRVPTISAPLLYMIVLFSQLNKFELHNIITLYI
jgi:hypothetical protein